MHNVARKGAIRIVLRGAARSLDLGRTLVVRRASRDPWTADGRALASDWQAVGRDMSSALKKFKEEMDDRKKA